QDTMGEPQERIYTSAMFVFGAVEPRRPRPRRGGCGVCWSVCPTVPCYSVTKRSETPGTDGRMRLSPLMAKSVRKLTHEQTRTRTRRLHCRKTYGMETFCPWRLVVRGGWG